MLENDYIWISLNDIYRSLSEILLILFSIQDTLIKFNYYKFHQIWSSGASPGRRDELWVPAEGIVKIYL